MSAVPDPGGGWDDIICPYCDGDGIVEGTEVEGFPYTATCPCCLGDGTVSRVVARFWTIDGRDGVDR